MCVCVYTVSVLGYVYGPSVARRRYQRDPLELELQVLVRHPIEARI